MLECLGFYWLQTTVCHHGLSSSMCVWIKDFLSNCWQAVRLDSHFSTSLTLNVGAPQGCVLGPFLYFLYKLDSWRAVYLGRAVVFLNKHCIYYTAVTAEWVSTPITLLVIMLRAEKFLLRPKIWPLTDWPVGVLPYRSVFHAAVAAPMLPYFFLPFSMLARQVPTQTHAPSVRSHKMQS